MSAGFLLDTMVPSELSRPRPDNRVERWLTDTDDALIFLSEAIAERWGILEGESQLRGRTLSVPDGLIAATALEHGLTLVTRNVKDFRELDVKLLNPWQD